MGQKVLSYVLCLFVFVVVVVVDHFCVKMKFRSDLK